MNIAVVLSIFISLGMTRPLCAAYTGNREQTFAQGLARFDAARTADGYREAARLFESMLADGYRNGAVYYNLGNAYFRAHEYGRAILNYRKALPYRPRDPYLAANLEQALAVSPGRLPSPPRAWWKHILFWSDWLAYPTKIYTALACAAVSAVALALATCLRRPRLHLVTLALLIVAAALGGDGYLCHPDVTDGIRAVITGETIARKGTGDSYEPAFDQPLRDGAEFRVLRTAKGWTFGHFHSIGDGWVRNEFVAR